jgi:hypothetical protein
MVEQVSGAGWLLLAAAAAALVLDAAGAAGEPLPHAASTPDMASTLRPA